MTVEFILHYTIRIMLFFFFSSRRRHTRWPRDWSSDVCSSDLPRREPAQGRHEIGAGDPGAERPAEQTRPPDDRHAVRHAQRSEERRVGKECRSRWAAED